MEFLWNCNNGIIDMKTGAFYEGHTDAFFTSLSPHSQSEIMKILEQIFPVWEDLTLFMNQVYLAMTEQVQENTIVVLSGGPVSGRTVIMLLIEGLFGDRFLKCSPTHLEEHQEVIRLPVLKKTKLLLVRGGENLNRDVISAITSGNQAFREIHHLPIKRKLGIWLFADEVPKVDESIKIIHIPFRSTFGNVTKPDEYLFKKNPRLITSIQSYVGSFMNLVLQFRPRDE